MLCVSMPSLYSHSMTTTTNSSIMAALLTNCCRYSDCRRLRYGYDCRGYWNESGKAKKNKFATKAKRGSKFSPTATSALAMTRNLSRPNLYLEVLKDAREKFTQEISFQSKDKDISISKALLYVAAEDEAFMAFNREMDACSLFSERRDASVPSDSQNWDCLEMMPLSGKSINGWLTELDAIAKEVEAELVSRDIGCHLVEVLEAVNVVLFKSRGFKRSPVLVDSKYSYLHSVLSCGCGSAILLSIIYIEVCRRLNLTIVGSRVGEDFLIWPQTGNPEELFKVTSGHSLFGVVNGRCVEDPRSKASDLNSNSLLGLEIATNRDIIGIALANMIRLHWKRASKTNHGLMLTSPLRPVHDASEKVTTTDDSKVPLLRPQDLRFKMLILQD
ncbi:uncharacterized protein LOC132308857 isoform X2 [Cornus florida]|uniref:uncharacterized protein LOC132308857 isoform X2 n=1 Tax=Cornus florida TaxID=4283 RepID=UPI002896DDFA|nr:uncharacterized protein LOC132308857 isoform X2 [Cornus florida]